jgi:hypothetical protein
MQRLKVLATALVVVFAVSAVAVASASAAPEVVKEGKAGVELVKKGLKLSGGAGELKAAGQTVKCSSLSGSGEGEGLTKVKNVKVIYKGCKLGTSECKTSGKGKEEISTETLHGEIGYLEKATKKVGNKLEPTAPATKFAGFTCGIITTEVTGCTINKLEPVNVLIKLKEFLKDIWNVVNGKQEWTKFEGGTSCTLKAFGGEAVLSSTANIEFEEEAELIG